LKRLSPAESERFEIDRALALKQRLITEGVSID
jgi:hypothetical protein